MENIDINDFTKYINSFYGKNGVYPNLRKKDISKQDVIKSLKNIKKSRPSYEYGGGDSIDREFTRDDLLKRKVLQLESKNMKISKTRLKEIVRETIVEENEYQDFFQSVLARHGGSIKKMGDQEKKDFFNKIDSAWNSKGEKRGKVKEKVFAPKSSPVFEKKVNESKFEKDDVVYNKKHKTIGIVRNVFDDGGGDLRTDADGVVPLSDLEHYNPMINKKHKSAKVAPSTKKEIDKRSLWTPFKQHESVNEEIYWVNSNNKKELAKFYDEVKNFMPDHSIQKLSPLSIQFDISKKDLADVKKMAKTYKGLKVITESINEDKKTVWKSNDRLYVDSDFVNASKGKLQNSELKHAGMGDFYLETPKGSINFSRVGGKFDGMSGRGHQMDGDKNLVALLIKKMGAKFVNENINESRPVKGKKSFYTQDNIGSTKYSINNYDGKATHKDGSPFYGIYTFKNKKSYEAKKKELKSQGYIEESKIVNEGWSDWKQVYSLKPIVALSKQNKNKMFLVTDDNYSRIGTFWLKNGKFAKQTVGNPGYDFMSNKTTLRARNDVIYKYKMES